MCRATFAEALGWEFWRLVEVAVEVSPEAAIISDLTGRVW